MNFIISKSAKSTLDSIALNYDYYPLYFLFVIYYCLE